MRLRLIKIVVLWFFSAGVIAYWLNMGKEGQVAREINNKISSIISDQLTNLHFFLDQSCIIMVQIYSSLLIQIIPPMVTEMEILFFGIPMPTFQNMNVSRQWIRLLFFQMKISMLFASEFRNRKFPAPC